MIRFSRRFSFGDSPSEAEPLLPLKLLLVEDNHDNRVLILSYLKKTPYQVTIAENGQIAVQKFKDEVFDLILIDMQMPVMDGYTATALIREWEQEHSLEPRPIVALTAYALKKDTQKSLDAGCSGHITKPIKKRKLLKTILKYTGNQ